MRSLRARLLLGLLTAVLVAQAAIYLLIYARIEDEIDELFDAELERSALAVSANGYRPVSPLPVRQAENPQQEMIIATFEHGRATTAGPNGLEGAIPPDAPVGFSKIMVQNRQWRLFTLDAVGRRIVAAQPADIRNIAARKITLRAIAPSLAVLPFAALMIGLAISYGLRPLARITHSLRGRSHRNLSAVDIGGLPRDLEPVAVALNELMQRLSDTLCAQKTFIADAAHELLTPLTALKLQAQMLARAKTPAREIEAMGELQGGIARTLQLAQSLLTLARLDSEADLDAFDECSLPAAVLKSLSIHIRVAEEKQLTLSTGRMEEVSVRGHAEAVAILSSTLIDNAVKYTDRAGSLRIEVHGGSRPELRVEDSGPGIPEEEHARVFDRFYRRRDAPASGSGLGLAIAKDTAARCNATIVLGRSADLGGLRASVFFSAPHEAVGESGQYEKIQQRRGE